MPLLVLLSLLLASPASAHEGLDARIERVSDEIAATPLDAALWRTRAELWHRAGMLSRALHDLDAAAAIAPHEREVQLLRAAILLDQGDYEGAEDAADAFLAAGAPLGSALSLRAGARAARGDLDAALDDLDAAIALAPTPELALSRGRLAAERGDLERAAAGYRAVLVALHGAAVVHLALIEVERARGRPDLALIEVDQLLATVPDHPEWLLLRADLHAESGDAAAAHADRTQALTVLDAALATRPTEQRLAVRERARSALDGSPQP